MDSDRIIDPSMKEFTLVDSQGTEHAYLVVMHPGGEGMDIVAELLAVGIGPIVEAIGVFVGSDGIQSLIGGDSEAAEAALEAFAQLDLSRVASETRAVLVTGRVPQLLRKVLARTQRDGRPLKESRHYDAAWRGNYAEALMAAWRVIEINDFFGPLLTLVNLQTEAADTMTSSPEVLTGPFGGSASESPTP
ncbi:MAG: hypothetical protein AAGA48_27590 [Myxococcota bacterium]